MIPLSGRHDGCVHDTCTGISRWCLGESIHAFPIQAPTRSGSFQTVRRRGEGQTSLSSFGTQYPQNAGTFAATHLRSAIGTKR